MQFIPPYGARSQYSTFNEYPTSAYPLTVYGSASEALSTIIPSIKNGKVRTPTDMANISILVLDSIGIETGKYETTEKKAKISNDSLAADTIKKKVAIMQRLAKLSKDRGATQTNSAIRNGFAYEFYCNVEAPGVCNQKPPQQIKKDLDKVLYKPFYMKTPFIVGASVVGIGLIGMLFFGGSEEG